VDRRIIATLLAVVLVTGIVVGYAIGFYTVHPSSNKNNVISIYAAGSLKNVLGDRFNPEFENITGINSGLTFGGSVGGAGEIKSGANFDVFISAAAGVIPQYLMPNYTKWMVIFASNEMAVTWTNNSYRIAGPFWFENLSAPGVKVAVSNSSLDPSGFQAIEMIKLAGILYTNWSNPYVKEAFGNDYSMFKSYNSAWNSWFGENGSLERSGNGHGYPVNDSMALYDQLFKYKMNANPQQLILSTVEIDLNNYLTTGAADYALTYRSQAVNQHLYYYQNPNGSNGLPSWINLGNISPAQVRFYQEVNTSGPPSDNIGNFPGGPILYAATILTASRNTADAQQFIYYLISNLGVTSLRASDFDPITVPFIYSPLSSQPAFLAGLTQPVPGYIPSSSYEEV